MRAALALLLLLLLSVGGAATQPQTGCSCLSWRDAYANRGVRCGQGYELGNFRAKIERSQLPASVPTGNGVYDEFCTNFYMKASFSKCFNTKYGSPSEQWCYVSPECEGAERVEGANAAVRLCTDGDELMSATAPEELNRLGSVDKLERGLFGKLSYAMEPEKWSAVEAASALDDAGLKLSHTMEAFYGIKWQGRRPATEAASAKLAKVAASGVATIFDADNGHGGGTLVLGSKIYAFLPTKDIEGMAYVCIAGCFI